MDAPSNWRNALFLGCCPSLVRNQTRHASEPNHAKPRLMLERRGITKPPSHQECWFVTKVSLGKDHGASRVFQRFQASSRAFLLASLASGASPARMKPCPAPS